MAVKLRLQRHGRKKRAFYHIVAVDSRAPRDSKTIEKLGTYNPNTNPATINLNIDSAVKWVECGAQPTDTTRAILSYKGVLYKAHLNKGVKKGALTQEQADAKFEAWLQEKASKISSKEQNIAKSRADIMAERLKAETQKNQERASAIAAKNAPPVEEVAEEGSEEATEEVVAENAPEVSETENTASEEGSSDQAEEGSEEPKA